MYKIICCDYDGTLVTSCDEVLSLQFLEKLHNLASRGIIFTVASGRPYNQLKKIFAPVFSDIAFIASDGAQIMYKNCLLGKTTMCLQDVKALAQTALDFGLSPIAALREQNKSISREQLALPFLFSSDIFKLIVAKNGKSAQALKQKASTLSNVRICYEDASFIEFCASNANKGNALNTLMQKFSCPIERVCAIGDGKNDLEMLKLVKNTFRPKCADEQIIDIAQEINVKQFIMDI